MDDHNRWLLPASIVVAASILAGAMIYVASLGTTPFQLMR